MNFSNASNKKIWPFLIILAVVLPLLFVKLSSYPAVWYDEGFRMNAASTFNKYGIIGTYTSEGLNPFDPAIATGPLDILLTSFSFRLFGNGTLQARLGTVPFAIMGILSVFLLARYLFGTNPALFITLFVLLIPPVNDISFVMLSRQVMGEVPSFSLIILGLYLLFLSWERKSWSAPGIAAGICIGLGLLSKTQNGISLVPVLSLVLLIRILRERSWASVIKYALPMVFIAAILGLWKLIEYSSWPDVYRAENIQFYKEAFNINFITPVLGKNITSGATFLLVISMLTLIATVLKLYTNNRTIDLSNQKIWAEIVIILAALSSMAWVSFVSIGWTRYFFFGWMLVLILLGNLLWKIATFVIEKIAARIHFKYGYTALFVATILAAVFINYEFILKNKGNYDADQMGAYIHTNIAPSALIESWDWQIDALSGHWNMHHPDSDLLHLAIKQHFIDNQKFALDYQFPYHQAQYLLIGPFGEWTLIYTQAVAQTCSKEIAQYGTYRLYQCTVTQ